MIKNSGKLDLKSPKVKSPIILYYCNYVIIFIVLSHHLICEFLVWSYA